MSSNVVVVASLVDGASVLGGDVLDDDDELVAVVVGTVVGVVDVAGALDGGLVDGGLVDGLVGGLVDGGLVGGRVAGAVTGRRAVVGGDVVAAVDDESVTMVVESSAVVDVVDALPVGGPLVSAQSSATEVGVAELVVVVGVVVVSEVARAR